MIKWNWASRREWSYCNLKNGRRVKKEFNVLLSLTQHFHFFQSEIHHRKTHNLKTFEIFLYPPRAHQLDLCSHLWCKGNTNFITLRSPCGSAGLELLRGMVWYQRRRRCFCAVLIPSVLPQVVYLTNSGSEANDLAMFMARVHTRNFDIICLR